MLFVPLCLYSYMALVCEHPIERTVLKNSVLAKGMRKAEFITVNAI